MAQRPMTRLMIRFKVIVYECVVVRLQNYKKSAAPPNQMQIISMVAANKEKASRTLVLLAYGCVAGHLTL